MSATLDLTFLDSATLGQPGSLEKLIAAYTELGFAIEAPEAGDRKIEWSAFMQQPEASLAEAYRNSRLDFHAFQPSRNFGVYQQTAWGETLLGAPRRAWVSASTDNTPYFWKSAEEAQAYADLLLALGKRLYAAVRPSFGWIDFNYGLRTSHEDIEAGKLPAIYWANFFGESYLRSLGREFLLQAPVWRTELLRDEGVLLVLAPSPGIAASHASVEQLKDYFSVPHVR